MASTKRQTTADWQLPYTPREYMLAFHQRTTRNAFMVCHRRAGKTVAAVAELIIRAVYTPKKNGQYFYVCPFRSQAKAVAWQYLVDMTEGLATEVKVSELSVTLPNGSKITLSGSDNVNALRGLYADGVILDEFAQCRPDLLQAVIMPCLLDRQGWLLIIGTSYGRLNQFFEYYEIARNSPAWYFADIKITDTTIIPEAEKEALQASMSEPKWEQEMMNSFSAELQGTYYANIINRMETEGRLKSDKPLYDPHLPVNVAFDIGKGDSTAVWFWQEKSDGIYVVDFFIDNGEQAQYYLDMLDGKKYTYERICLPHDAKNETFASHKSAREQFLDHFKDKDGQVVMVPRLSVEDGIEAARITLPKCYFDYTACYEGVESLRVYRKKWDELNQCFSKTPAHDFASDPADAFRYMSIMAYVNKKPAPAPYSPTLISAGDRTAGSLAEMFKANEKKPKGSFARHRV